MKQITEIARHASPANLPQALTWDGSSFWMGSLDTQRVYEIDPERWEVKSETRAPGNPFSIVAFGDELRVLCGESDEDNRYIRRFAPGEGFDADFKIQCPEDTGSQLSYDGKALRVSQWYNQLVLTLDDAGQVTRSFKSPHEICGQVMVGDTLYLLSTKDESTDDYWITKVDINSAEPTATDVAKIPFKARSLAHDGRYFWTNHREIHETVCFSI